MIGNVNILTMAREQTIALRATEREKVRWEKHCVGYTTQADALLDLLELAERHEEELQSPATL